MLLLITYDIETVSKEGRRRLSRVSKTCLDYGQRVQNSVFECDVDPTQWEILKDKLLKEFSSEKDSLRFYYMGSNWEKKIEHYGTKPSINLASDTLII